jgi:protein SCO1/2
MLDRKLPNKRWLIGAVPIFIAAGLAALLWMGGTRDPRASPAPAAPTIDASLAKLVDHQGRPVDDGRFKGRYRLVTFGFTSCPDICPMTLMGYKEILARLGERSDAVAPIFISVDPIRDGGDRLAEYVRAFDPRIEAYTGTLESLESVAKAYQVFFERRLVDASTGAYVFDHSAVVLLIDPEQRIRASVAATGTPEEIATAIVAAFDAADAGRES